MTEDKLEMAIAIVEAVRKDTPYLASVFPDRTPEQVSCLHEALKDRGASADGFFGSFGRQVWDDCCARVMGLLQEEMDEAAERRESE